MSQVTSKDYLSAFERMFFCEPDGRGFAQNFFSRIPVDIIFRLGQTNSRLESIVDDCEHMKWDIDEYLADWFRDPKSFRKTLGKCDAVMSGWHTLRFFDRSLVCDRQQNIDLEIVLRLDGVLKMGQELECQGLTFLSMTGADNSSFTTQVKALIKKIISAPSYHPYQQRTRVIHRFQFAKFLWDTDRILHHRCVEITVVTVNPVAYIVETSKDSEWRCILI
jgi:hypothetical protein